MTLAPREDYDPAADQAPRSGGVLLLGPVPPPPQLGGIANGIGLLRHSPLAHHHGMGFFNTFRVPDATRTAVQRLRYQAGAYARFVSMLLRHRPALVHIKTAGWVNFYQNAGYCMLARICGRRCVLQVHDGTFPEFYRSASAGRQRVIRRLLRVPNTVVALSTGWAAYFRDTLAVRHLEVVPNGLLTARFRDAAPDRSGLGLPADRIIVLFMGTASATLDERKGVHELIDAIAALRAEHPQALLVLAGGAAPEARLRQCLGLPGDGWLMLGPIDPETKAVLYRSVDIFALPSHAENMPNTVLEAMAAGCAIVATNVGAVPEMLAGGAAGVLVPARDTSALTLALRQLVGDPSVRHRLGSRAATDASVRYDLAVVEYALAAVYDALLTQPTPAAASEGTSPESKSGT